MSQAERSLGDTALRGLVEFVRAPVAGETWRALGYTLVSVFVAIPAFQVALLGLVAGALSLVLLLGLPILALVLAGARFAVTYFRWPARALLGRSWPGPEPLAGRGPVGRMRAVLVDGQAWRALAYCFLRLPLAATTAYLGLAALGIGLVSFTCPVWALIVPRGSGPIELNNWRESWTVATGGVIILLVFPWVVRLPTLLDRYLIDTLLAPGPAAQRIARLESSRAALTADAATTLRRLERDLHDGTQARLVSLGMALSRIERRVNRLPDDLDGIGELRGLAGSARESVTDGLAELRDIVRGIHPPALDDGLATALATLSARSGLPVDVRVELAEPPSDAAASTLYFAAAELLTNAARHAGAGRVALRLTDDDGVLRLVVTDDGRGGATPPGATPPGGAVSGSTASGATPPGDAVSGATPPGDAVSGATLPGATLSGGGARDGSGTGLAGLAKRAEALDGRLDVVSPSGGPTTVTMTLPRG